MAKIHIETYGCTMNQADSDTLAAVLRGKGHGICAEDGADVIVLNTCTVKGATENRIMERIRRLGADNGRMVIAGCMAVNAPKIRKLTGAPIVWPGAIARIGDAVDDALCGRVTEYRSMESREGLPSIITTPIMRLSIAEGCTGSCSFCQTKLARPGLRSMSHQSVLKRIAEGVRAGAKEIQVTAMDTGAYGLDIGTDLPSLLKCINDVEGDFLARVGMVNPDHVKRMEKELIGGFNLPKIYKFIHIPVQSGSEKVCREMGRNHTVADFEQIVRDFRKEVPGITIATDIIVGYPTESEEDYKDTLALMNRVKPDVINLSKFSPRPGTKAKELPQLDNDEVKSRSVEASALVRRICEERNKQLVGKVFDVLVTEKQKDYTGRTIGYKQVVMKGYSGELGRMVGVKITDANHGSLFGEQAWP